MGRLDEINAAVEAVSSEQNDARQGSLLGATEQNPDEVGEAARLGRKLSLPTAVVVDNLPELRRKRKLEEINAAITDAPVLSRELQKPEFAGVAHDDVAALKSTEWAASFKPTINGTDVSMLIEESMKRNPALDWDTARANVLRKYNVDADATGLLKTPQQPTLTPESFITGLFTSTKNLIPKMREQARMQFAGTLGLPEMEARALRRYEQYESRDSLATPSFEATTYPSDPYTPVQERSELARYGYGGAQSVITNIPGLTLAILTKNPYVALAPAVTQTELDQYARTRARGGSVLESTTAGVLSGVVEGVTELYPMKFLVDSFGRKTIMQIVTGDQIREQLGEQVATWFQDAIDTAIANPNKTWAEYFKERPDAMAQTAVAVLMQSAVVATAGVVANSTAGKNDASIKADQYAQTLLKLTQLAEASKIRARDPESFQQFVASVTEDGPVQDVWVSPNTLMQAGVDVRALAAVSPSFSAQLDEALQTNGEVRIPVAEFATTLPGTGFEQAILPHLRTDPDMPTQAEAQVFMQTQAEEFQREAEQVLAQQENAAAFNTSAQVVEDSILSQLKTANRFTDDVNQEYATLARSVFTSAAARLGVTPEEAYQKFALQVRAQQITAQYDQVSGQLRTETPEFKTWFGDSKVVDAEGKPLTVWHQTNEDFAEFDIAKSGRSDYGYAGKGFYFAGKRPDSPVYGVVTMPVYLSLQNPYIRTKENWNAEFDPYFWIPLNSLKYGSKRAAAEEWTRLAKEKGYDGVIDMSSRDGEKHEIVAFSPTQIKSVFNRGTFDPNDPNILNQSTRDFSMTEEEEAVSLIDWVYGDRPRFTTANSLREFGELLVEMSPKAHGEHTDENRDFIAGVMVKEVEAALRSGNHAAGWYKQNLETALQIAAIEHPEILESEIEKFTFNYILAVTSNGLDIGKNYALANTLYADYRKKGRLSTDTEGLLKPGGARVHDMAKAFQLFNNVKNHEGLELFKEFMLTKHDVGLMKKINPGIRELVDQELYGGTVIGSKIGGGFLQNLNGNHDALTMDRWFLRMWGRVSGTLLDDASESGLLDDPKNGGNRAFMRETAELALAQVRARGHDIEMSDLQALLWYPEKELYAMHGVADAHVEGTDYASEAAKHAAARGYGEHPVVAEALRNASAPVGRAGRRASDTGRGGAPAGTGAYAQGPTVTQEAQALVDQHTPELIEEYFSRFGNVIDPDNVKQLFPAYVANPSLAAAVHEPSSQLAKAIFTEALRRNAGAPVVFTAGGGGSGKTEAMSVAQALLGGPQEGGLIYDSTLSSFESAVRRIDEALATGSEVDIVYTNREVGDAFEFAMQRARVVPVPVLARAHVGAAETIRQLEDHYAGNPQVQISVVNNLGEIDDINLGSLADVPTYEYNEVERRLYELARRAKETNRISESRYAALTAPAGGTPEVSAGGLQEGEQGQDLGGIDEGLARLFQSSAQQPITSSVKITSLDEFDTNMPAFLRKDGWIVITATTSGDPYSEANVAANQALEEDLKARGLPYRAGEGFYLKDPQGTSFLVQGDEALGIELAKKYHQESVLTKDGYVYQDGSLTTVDHTKDTFGEEAKKQDGYTTIGDKTFSLGLEFAYRVAKEHRPKLGLGGAVHGVRAVHFSPGKRTVLSSSMYGRGAKGAEFERVANDEVLSHRIHFYVSNGQGVFPEDGVGNEAHLAILNNLYDMSADPLNVRFKPASEMEHALVAAGYSGMLVRDVFTRQGAVVLLGRQNVPVEATDDPNGWAEVPPPPKETTGAKRALLDFASDRRLPAGQLAPAAWEAYVLRIAPERHEALKGTGIFDAADQSPKYRDEMVKAVLSQEGAAPRGQIAFGPDITQQASTITLLQQADLSTFIHELGHFQLEVLASMATTDASAAGDMQTILSWLGVRDLAAWNTMTLEEKRPYHEQFARGFESYLFEGKAPAVELQGAFARVRAWMLNVYKNLTALNVTLTDEVRGVFDRMLATEQQIADAESARGFGALFSSADAAGMTAEEWTQYQSLQAAATEEAKAELQSRSLRNMQWLTNAKGRELKRLQKDAAAKRKSVEAEVREEVRAQPVYGARRFLAYGEVGPEVLFSEGEELSGKLDLGALKEMYGEGPAALWRYLPTGENGLAGLEGLHPDQVAEMFGFTSGDHLVRELLAAHPEAEVVEGMTDQRMLERYGDLSDPVNVERAAEKAIHNEVRAKVISTELAALARATGQRRPLVTAAREFAERVVARTLVRRLKPAQYAAAEGRAAKGAMTALAGGNLVEAAVEKRNQLVNNLTAKAAVEAAGEIEQGVIYLKKFLKEGTRGKIDIDYLDQIDAILERFDLRTGQSLRAIDKRKSLADWIAAQEDMGLDPAIPDNIRDAAFRKHYKDLTVEEFRGLIDGVRNIEHLGRLKTKLLTAVRQREFAAAVEEIVTSIEENATGTVEERRTSDRGRLADIGTVFRGFLADHRKFASLMREMDGWKDGGTAWEYFVRGMNRAGDFEATEREKATIRLSELLKPILKAGALGKKTYFPQIGKSFTREERIGIALNVGNETNRERLLTGEKLSPVQLQSILDTLTQEEWQFVDSIWKYFETFRPQIAEKERRLTGVEPEWVKPTPVMTKFGELAGGYYPIAYDTLRSTRAEADTAAEVQRQLERGLYVRAQTRRGHTKARVESTGRPIRYDLGVIVKHVDQVVHDLAWHEFLIDANRLLRNGKVDAAIREHYGVEKLRALKDTLRDIAIGDMAAQTSGERILNHLRHGATIVGLGWRITTSLLQPIGLTQSIVRVGPQWIAKGVRHWAGDTVRLENSARVIGEKSDFMRLRAKTLQREINEIRNKVAGRDSVMEASYFYLIQKLQLVADIPTWWGAYEKAMASEDNEARAIALADQAVIDAQGSGQIKDLSQIQRGSAGWKLFTNFYSFFNTTYNLTREALGRTSFRSPGSIALLGVDLLLLYTIPAILGTLMKAALSGDWDDEEELLRKLLADQVNYLTGTMVLVREAGGVAQNMIDPQHSFDYTGPASLRFFSEASKLAKQIGQGEADEPFWKALNNVSGTIFHYPAGQINATVDGIASIADGKTQNPGALAVGHSDR